jgi:hypothetical protein
MNGPKFGDENLLCVSLQDTRHGVCSGQTYTHAATQHNAQKVVLESSVMREFEYQINCTAIVMIVRHRRHGTGQYWTTA